ncbi:uncharacterized protein BCN122_II1812 [Burkholderia cenocepacia]|nr:uncharacterized protein BCN122_II1812 [Burkholderia cenocepacia]
MIVANHPASVRRSHWFDGSGSDKRDVRRAVCASAANGATTSVWALLADDAREAGT